MSAMHESDHSVKEHLIERVNDLEKVNMERSTELLFARRTMQQMIDEKSSLENKAIHAVKELHEFKSKQKRKLK